MAGFELIDKDFGLVFVGLEHLDDLARDFW